MLSEINMDKQLVDFLIRAKQATYAGKGAETASSRVKSHDLVFKEGEYMYYDAYLGGDKFAGEEALWISEVPYWSMNYIGRVIGANFSGDFLKEALLKAIFIISYFRRKGKAFCYLPLISLYS
jgi:hypothetical protein